MQLSLHSFPHSPATKFVAVAMGLRLTCFSELIFLFCFLSVGLSATQFFFAPFCLLRSSKNDFLFSGVASLHFYFSPLFSALKKPFGFCCVACPPKFDADFKRLFLKVNQIIFHFFFAPFFDLQSKTQILFCTAKL